VLELFEKSWGKVRRGRRKAGEMSAVGGQIREPIDVVW